MTLKGGQFALSHPRGSTGSLKNGLVPKSQIDGLSWFITLEHHFCHFRTSCSEFLALLKRPKTTIVFHNCPILFHNLSITFPYFSSITSPIIFPSLKTRRSTQRSRRDGKQVATQVVQLRKQRILEVRRGPSDD